MVIKGKCHCDNTSRSVNLEFAFGVVMLVGCETR